MLTSTHRRRRSHRRRGALLVVPLVLGLAGSVLPAAASGVPTAVQSAGAGSQAGAPAGPDSRTGVYQVLIPSSTTGGGLAEGQPVHELHGPDGSILELTGDAEAFDGLTPGQQVTVLGTTTAGAGGAADTIEVQAVVDAQSADAGTGAPAGAPVPAAAASTGAAAPVPVAPVTRTSLTPGAKKVAVVILSRSDFLYVPKIGLSSARQAYFTEPNSVAAYVNEASWGQNTLTGRDRADGDVYGPVALPVGTGCRQEVSAGATAAAAAGIDLTGYDYVSFVLDGYLDPGCGYAGYGYLGGRDSLVHYGSPESLRYVAIHELGHNFGLEHAGGLNCQDGLGARVPLQGAGHACTVAPYGDPLDMMGAASRAMPFSAFHKARLGWTPESRILTVSASGEYALHPSSTPGTAIQLLRVLTDTPSRFFYVDLRQPYGQYWEKGFDRFPGLEESVVIREGDGRSAALVDTVPSTAGFHDAALGEGLSITDPSTGIVIENHSVQPGQALVKVTYPRAAFPQVYLRGTHNGWATTTRMTPIAHDVWQAQVSFGSAPNQRFKFDINGDWTQNFGDTNQDGVANAGGSDIPVTQGAGTYVVTFKGETKEYTVERLNDPPVADAGADRTVLAGQPFTLDASGSSDPDGSISIYGWSCCTEPGQTGGPATHWLPQYTLTLDTPGVYQARLIVMDDRNATDIDYVTITVVDTLPNQAPTANAGPDQTVVAGSWVTLTGLGSSDPDGTVTSYVWTGAGLTLHGITRTAQFTTPGVYTMTLTVTDNQGATGTDTVTITVTPLTSVYPQVYLRGTHNAWGVTTPMTLVAHNTWRATATFGSTSTERFKFDVHGNWATSFGDNAPRNGIADLGGADIPITGGAGTYEITFNDSTKAYTVVRI